MNMPIDSDVLLDRLEKMQDAIKEYAKAKSERVYLEQFRKSKKALLMKQSGENTVNAQEREAYANEEYQELLKGLAEAVRVEETHRWTLTNLQMQCDVYRTIQANQRAVQDRV